MLVSLLALTQTPLALFGAPCQSDLLARVLSIYTHGLPTSVPCTDMVETLARSDANLSAGAVTAQTYGRMSFA